MEFSKGVSPWILSKNQTFCYRRFSQKWCQKRSFFDILERKQSFLDQKIEVLTRAKKIDIFKGVSPYILKFSQEAENRHFLKGFVHGFCPKIELFLISVFTEIISEKIVLRYLWKKTIFLDQKLEVLTRAKKWTFRKGLVHGFCPIIEFSLIAVFHRNYVRRDRSWIF